MGKADWGLFVSHIETSSGTEWARRAALSCLLAMGANGTTHSSLAVINAIWIGPGDEFSVVYVPPWGGEQVGLRRRKGTKAISTYPLLAGNSDVDPALFGKSVAQWDLGEPMGYPEADLWRDSAGVYWWGDGITD